MSASYHPGVEPLFGWPRPGLPLCMLFQLPTNTLASVIAPPVNSGSATVSVA